MEVANGLEPAKALRTEIADLALAIDSVSDLQVQFYELSSGRSVTVRSRTDLTHSES